MITVPQSFFKASNVDVLLRAGNNAILKKKATSRNPDNDRYLAAHAMTIVHAGSLTLQIPDGPVVTVTPNHWVFIPRGIYMISDIIPEDRPFEATVLFFDDLLIDDFIRKFNIQLPIDKEKTEVSPEVFKLLADQQNFLLTLEKMYSELDHETLVRNKLEEFLYLILRSTIGSQFLETLSSIGHKQKESITSFMDRNFDKPLKIEDYAYLTGRSVASFHRDFKRHFGMAPKAWLLEKRLQQAKLKLEQTDITIHQLASDTGYENVSHFIKAFQIKFGISPKQYQIQQKSSILI